MHGYDLRKRLRSGAGLLASLSYGSLYPALARLERAGAVRELEPRPDGDLLGGGAPRPGVLGPGPADVIPLSGSLSGEKAAFRVRLAARAAARTRATARAAAGTRGRKVYELTSLGEEMFSSLLADDGEPDRSTDDRAFTLRWSFARYLPAEGRVHLLERQRRRLEDRIHAAKRGPGGAAPLDRYERQIADHALESLNRDLAWIESLIAMERSGAAGPAIRTSETDVS